MSSVDVFGKIKSGVQLENTLIDLLRTWMPTYIAEVAGQHDYARDRLPNIQSYQVYPDADKWPEQRFPAMVIVSAGTVGRPIRRAEGKIEATWETDCVVFTSGATIEQTKSLSKIYTAVVRAVIMQHKSIGGYAIDTAWTGESYDILRTNDSRSLAAGAGTFEITVPETVDTSGGPRSPVEDVVVDPLPDPTTPYDSVNVDEVIVDIERSN